MPTRLCIGCPAIFTGTGQRCPACKRQHEQARGTRDQRGYGAAHQAERTRQLARWTPGQPCAICSKPTWDKTRLDLAHNPTRTGWLGLAHAACNRATTRRETDRQ